MLLPFFRRDNGISEFNPFREFDEMERAFFGGMDTAFKTDIKDNGSEYILEADLPGFEKEDIKIDITDNCMTITAERKSETEEKDDKGNFIRRERSYGAFRRSFDTSGIDVDKMKASYKNGVLKLVMPKMEQVAPPTKRLEIE